MIPSNSSQLDQQTFILKAEQSFILVIFKCVLSEFKLGDPYYRKTPKSQVF